MFGKIFGGSKDKKASSSSSKASPKPSPGKKKNDDLAAFGIDPSLLEDPLDDDDAAIDDADMDVDVDAIMNEINAPKKQPAKGASKGGSSTNTPKSGKQAQPNVNITIDINSLPKEDEEPEVELTDEDMKDPSLLSELLGLGVEGIDQDPELAALLNQGGPAEPEDEEDFELDEEDMKDPSLLKEFKSLGGTWTDPKEKKRKQQTKLLEERIKEFKDAALKAKKDNNIDQAKEYLRIFKSLEQTLESVQKGAIIDEGKIPAAPKPVSKPKTEASQLKPTAPQEQAAAPVSQPKPATPQPVKAQPTPQTNTTPQVKAEPAKAQPTPQAQTEPAPQPKGEPVKAAPAKVSQPAPTQQAPSKTTTPPPTKTEPAPQPVATPKATTQPVPTKAAQPAPQAKQEPAKDNTGAVIQSRMNEYKSAALASKQANDLTHAKEYMLCYKKCQALQEKHQRGEPVGKVTSIRSTNLQDVSQLPPSLQSKSNAPAKQTQAAPTKAAPAKVAAQPAKVQAKAPPQAAPQKEEAEEDDDPNPYEMYWGLLTV